MTLAALTTTWTLVASTTAAAAAVMWRERKEEVPSTTNGQQLRVRASTPSCCRDEMKLTSECESTCQLIRRRTSERSNWIADMRERKKREKRKWDLFLVRSSKFGQKRGVKWEQRQGECRKDRRSGGEQSPLSVLTLILNEWVTTMTESEKEWEEGESNSQLWSEEVEGEGEKLGCLRTRLISLGKGNLHISPLCSLFSSSFRPRGDYLHVFSHPLLITGRVRLYRVWGTSLCK